MIAEPLRGLVVAQRATDSDIIKLLLSAAKSAQRSIERLDLKPGIGARTRANQQRVALAEIHRELEKLWNGVDSAVRVGIVRAQQRAEDAATELDVVTRRALGKADAARLEGVWAQSARRGVQVMIARERSGYERKLSARVYRNKALTEGWVDRAVTDGIARGVSAKELARDVRDLIRPDVRGGVSYAAMRLARTEIANAHHVAQIAAQDEAPWVIGFKWNLSGSHPKDDICDTLAGHNEGLGEGVFARDTLPKLKPHPHCLCYLTAALQPTDQFVRDLRAGRYDFDPLSATGAA